MNQSTAQHSNAKRIAFVQSCWHRDIVDRCRDSFLSEVARNGVDTEQVDLFEVPGAFEIPLVVQEIAAHREVDAVIALGVIIEGETAHATLIGRTVTDALQRIALTHRVPVVHEVLLLKNEEQAQVRCCGTELNRGIEAARVAVRMAQVMSEVGRR